MAGIPELIQEALAHPLVGGAVLAWTAAVSIFIYWVKRHDDAKPVSLITRGAGSVALVVAILLTGASNWPSAPKQTVAVYRTTAAPKYAGHQLIGITDQDWNCTSYNGLRDKYHLLDKVDQIENLAKKGDPDFLYLAGRTYSPSNLVDQPDDPQRSLDYTTRSAIAGGPRGMIALADLYIANGDIAKGVQYAEQARKSGLGIAELFTAQLYDGTRQAGLPPNSEQAARHYHDAIEKGCIGVAAYSLGLLYYYGKNVDVVPGRPSPSFKIDKEQGLRLVEQSAKVASEYQNLALNFVLSESVRKKDTSIALFYIDDAVRLCADECADTIADYYYASREYKDAVRWYERATARPFIDAAERKRLTEWAAFTRSKI